MRLSTVQIFQQGVNAILDRQFELNQTQQQIASGKRVSTPADDPVAAVQILDISEDLKRVDQFQRNGSLAETQLTRAETTLADVGNVLQRVRELVVQANNATQDAGARRAIAAEVEQRLEELVDLANTRDANDEYIFAGFQSRSRPFEQSGNQVVYRGDDGQRFLQVGADAQVAVREPGSGVFVDVPLGNGRFGIVPDAGNSGTGVVQATAASASYVADNYTISFSRPTPQDPVSYEVTDGSAAVVASGTFTSGEPIAFNGASVTLEGRPADGDSFRIGTARRQDLFSTLSGIADALSGAEDTPAGGAAVNNALNSGLRNLDQGLEVILGKRAEIGARLNRVETQRALSEDFALQLKESLSDLEDLDLVEAIARLNLQVSALQAAQQTFARVQGLSLFNFL